MITMKNARCGKSLVGSAAAAVAFLMAVLPGVLLADSSRAAQLIWTGDFETGDFSQYGDKSSGLGVRSSTDIVTSPVRAGKYASELTILGHGHNGIERAELRTARKDNGNAIRFEWDGPEYWVGFSFLFKEWNGDAWTLFQIHAPNEPKGNSCDFAGNAISIYENTNEDGTHNLDLLLIENGGASNSSGAGSNTNIVHSYPLPLHEWQDYVINFKLSTQGDGFYHVWKNGEKIYSKTGLTNVNYKDSCGNRIPERDRAHNGVHIGVYGPGDPVYRRVFYDAVRVAKGADGFGLVDPGQGEKPVQDDPEQAAPKPPVIVKN